MCFSKSTIIKIVILVVSIYIGICIGVALMQDRMLYHPNVHKSDISEAKKVLSSLAKSKANPILAFNAQATLDVWKQQGYLKF
jgi:hypothetical protein